MQRRPESKLFIEKLRIENYLIGTKTTCWNFLLRPKYVIFFYDSKNKIDDIYRNKDQKTYLNT